MYEYKYKGFTVKIEIDPEPVNPREADNLGTIVCFFNKQVLGDSHAFKNQVEVMSYVEVQKAISRAIYSDLSSTPFKKWDTKQVGIIYAEAYKIYKKWDVKRILPKVKKEVLEALAKELNIYDLYLRGNVFCYSVVKGGGKPIKGKGSFYGFDFKNNGLLESARACVSNVLEG